MKDYTKSINEITKIIDDANRLMIFVKDIVSKDYTLRDDVNKELPLGVPIESEDVYIGDIQFHYSHPVKASWSNVTGVTLYMHLITELGVDLYSIYLDGAFSARLVRQLVSRMSEEV